MDEAISCMAVRLPRFVMRQDVALCLPIKNVDVVISQVDWFYPVTGGFNHHWDASTFYAARDKRCVGYLFEARCIEAGW